MPKDNKKEQILLFFVNHKLLFHNFLPFETKFGSREQKSPLDTNDISGTGSIIGKAIMYTAKYLNMLRSA